MTIQESRILIAGDSTVGLRALAESLSSGGTRVEQVRGVQEAVQRLGDFHFDAVLASEVLSDGRAYELMPFVEKQRGSLLVAVALSESALWLPVVESGRRVLGTRALNARMLESELNRLLSPEIQMLPSRSPLRADGDARSKILARRAAALPIHLASYDSLDARRESFDQLTASLSVPQLRGKEDRREPGRFERAFRRAALGNRRTA